MRELLHHDGGADNCESDSDNHYIWPTTYPDTFTESDKEKLKDPDFFKRFRHELEHEMNVRSGFTNNYLLLIINLIVYASGVSQRFDNAGKDPKCIQTAYDLEASKETLDSRA